MKRAMVVSGLLALSAAVVFAAPQYLIDARGWDGAQRAQFVVRAMPELTLDEAWSGGVEIEGGELIEVRCRSREGLREAEGVSVDGARFEVEAETPMQDLAIEFTGGPDTRVVVELPGGRAAARVSELRESDLSLAAGEAPVRLLLTFIYPEDPPQPLTELKTLYPRTELIVDGTARCVIAVPPGGRHDEEARRLAEALSARGATPEILSADEVVGEDFHPTEVISRTNVIALGDSFSNRVIGSLFGRRLTRADALYPGPDGHVIRSVHDPFATGHNLLVLAGSDDSGVAQTVERFIEGYVAVGEGDLVLEEPIVDVEYNWVDHPSLPGPWEKRMPQVRSHDYIREFCMEEGVMNERGEIVAVEAEPDEVVRSVVSCMYVLATTWFYLGDEALPLMMAEMLEKNVEAFEAVEQVERSHQMAAGITQFTLAWDVIEQLPVFSDRMRLAMTNALLIAARAGHEVRSMHTLIREGCRQIFDENHGTVSMLQSFTVWQYFDRYYDLPESRYWMEMADAMFRGQAGSFQIPEDAAGYMGACPNQSTTFAMMRPDLEYFTRGVAAEHADYFMLAGLSNLGFLSGFGDTGGLSPYGYYPLFTRVLWHGGDGRYRWVLEHLLPESAGHRAFQDWLPVRADVPVVEPVDMTGVLVQPIYPRPVEKFAGRLDPVFLPREPYPDDRFNKIAMREAWGEDRQYLLLSGMRRDGHTHHDVNCIVTLTDNGRIWLADHEFALTDAASQTGVVAMRDGAWRQSARQAHLRVKADFPGSGLLRTDAAMGELTWSRNIAWLKGRWYVVLDDLEAEEAADYFVRASWRGLGEHELLADGMRLTQGDQRMRVVTDGEGSLDLTEVPFSRPGEWINRYGLDEAVQKVLRQDKVMELAEGESARLATGLHVAPLDEAEELRVARLYGPAAAVGVADERWIVSSGAFEAAEVAFAGEMALLGTGTIALADATAFTIGAETLLAAEQPVSVEIDIASGQLSVEAGDAPVVLTWRGQRVEIAPRQGNPVEINTDGVGELLEVVARLSEAALEEQRLDLAAQPEPLYEGMEVAKTVELDHPVSHLISSGDLLLAGAEDGAVLALDEGLQARWSWQAPGAITAMAVDDLTGDGRPEIVVGCEDHFVYALDGDGEEVLWSFEVLDADTHGGPRQAKDLLIADLDADGSPEVLAVAPYLHVLRSDGTPWWQEAFRPEWRGMVRGMCAAASVADLTGDGRLEVIVSFMDPYSGTRTLSHDGQTNFMAGGDLPQIHHSPPAVNMAVDLRGEGTKSVVIGTTTGVVTAPWDTSARFGDHLYRTGAVRQMFAGRSAEHDPLIIVTTETADVRGLYHRMADTATPHRLRQAWYTPVEEPITASDAADLTGDGLTETVVGTRAGNVRIIDSEGEIIARADSHGAPLSSITILSDGRIVAARGDGTVSVLRFTVAE